MAKKSYGKPIVIDLSIEGATGIGAKECNHGLHVSSSGCNAGLGAQTSCNIGDTVTSACDEGWTPNYTGTMCTPGLSNKQGVCNMIGNSANRNFCGDGGTPSICYAGFDQQKPMCEPYGNTNSLLCRSGYGQLQHFS